MSIPLPTDQLLSLFLHLVRAMAFLVLVPLLGTQRETLLLRLVLAVALGTMFWLVGGSTAAMPPDLLALGVTAAREAFVGLALGFAVSLLGMVTTAAGEIVGNEMGFGMARVLDPGTGADVGVVPQLFTLFGVLLALQLDLHHEALRILGDTYRSLPVGAAFDLVPLGRGLIGMVGAGILLALQFAFPVLAVMLLLTVGLVLLGRAVPHLNLMEFSFGLRALLALLAAAFFLGDGAPFLANGFSQLLGAAGALFP